MNEQEQNALAFLRHLPNLYFEVPNLEQLLSPNDHSLTFSQVSDGFLSMFGYTREELFDRFQNHYIEMLHPTDRKHVLTEISAQLKDSSTIECEYRVLRRDGSYLWVMDKGQLITNKNGKQSFYCILMDITAAKLAQEKLRLSLERLQIIMDQTSDILFEWDIQSDTLRFSANWKKKFGYTPITQRISSNLLLNSHIYADDLPVFLEIMTAARKGEAFAQAELRIRDAKHRYIWCRIRATAQFDEAGIPVKSVGAIVDIDSEKRMVQVLQDKAERDALTGLYNKMTAQALVENHLIATPNKSCALMIVDIDNFKMINDTMGHLFGDAVLSGISKELNWLFRSTDIIGRVGGDEFLVFLKNIPSESFALKKAEEILQLFTSFFSDKKSDCPISCSIGISVSPKQGQDFHQLFLCADTALYVAKGKGKKCCALYDGGQETPGVSCGIEASDFSISDTIDSNGGGCHFGNRLSDYVFHALYQSKCVEDAINLILEIVGKQFHVSRAYIFEDTEDGTACCSTFEWCNEGVPPDLQRIPYCALGEDYYANFNEDGIFYCRSVKGLPPAIRDLLTRHGVKALLQCAIRDGGKNRGFVGFDECVSTRFWNQEQIEALNLIAEILSTFLLKERAQVQAEKAAAQMRNILDQQSAWIYVINRSSYELLYINKKTLELAPDACVGRCCYETFFHQKEPCKTCPLQMMQTHLTLYNPIFQVWVAANASPIAWDDQDACLLTCHDITKFKSEEA